MIMVRIRVLLDLLPLLISLLRVQVLLLATQCHHLLAPDVSSVFAGLLHYGLQEAAADV